MRISDCSSDVCSSDLNRECYVLQRKVFHRPFDRLGFGILRWLEHVKDKPDLVSASPVVLLAHGRDRPLQCFIQGLGVIFERHNGGSVAEQITAVAGKRSEEHTSELQSLMRISYAVFCLKKKTNKKLKTTKLNEYKPQTTHTQKQKQYNKLATYTITYL